ncbi:MFS transporter [Sphingobacterium griseoflavum]|uniref:MFS transporter n=1 Tax=Sphingobacterium griseoflavum TaxID=1474952 RepID=A0ABQ3HXK3_9SPHI|nr:MFS transporter [Sphingobacterium griseoflavum]GHE44743.1 MFS transporter [Sphingobacterium griseoflavum]
MKHKTDNISLREKIGYGLGDAASSMFWKLFGMYLMFFYTDIFGMEAKAVGTMFLVTRVWDSLFDPVVGVLADRTRSRWGKFRPFILYIAVPFGAIGALTFFTPDVSPTGKIFYAYLTYSLMMMVYSAINVPYASLLGVISPLPKVRNVLATFRMTFAYIGSFVTLLLFNPLIAIFSNHASDLLSLQRGWFYAALLIATFSTILFLLCFYWTNERVVEDGQHRSTLKEDMGDLLKNRPWWILLGAGVAALVFNSIRDGAALYYFKYYVQEQDLDRIVFFHIPFMRSGLYLALGQAANIVGVVLAAPLSNRIGKKNTYMGAMGAATVGSILFYWLSKGDLMLMFTLQMLISICAGSIFPLLWSMYADCADYSELRTGNRATGLIFSSSSMSQKLGWAFGTALTGWLLGYFGFQANQQQTVETLNGIRMFLSFFPAIGTVLSVIFIFFYPLDEKRMETVTSELARKRGTRDR